VTLKLQGLLVHGLGFGLSTGLDALATKINMIDGVHVDVVEEGAFAYELLGRNESLLDRIVRSATLPLFGGHSMGADETWKMCVMLETILKQRNLHIPFAFSFDPTYWGTNGGPAGQWQIPSVVKSAMNFRQDAPPGGGRIVRAAIGTVEIHEETLADTHIGIAGDEVAHQQIIDKIIGVLATLDRGHP
jgi:hypothetical protein